MPESVPAARKRIVIFADGTGNAFSSQESNVWRLYQALDRSSGDQIAYYIKGVGTSGFRPFAILDGATGIGVPSNVRKLHEFICWNWHPGDEICMFGFSRGSFTVRTLIGLMDHEGLVPREIDGETVSRQEMKRNVMSAWRSYRSKTVPNNPLRVSPLVTSVRGVRNFLVGFYRALFRHRTYKEARKETERQQRSVIPINFVGLFDTVEAFGVPIEEFRRAIDWAIWPISFRNARLSKRVRRAFHALSLDDERTTFHPLRFDMRGEQPSRISEVWFAGVHSDVGGGYPDADLEHVPLVWMADHAVAEGGLRFNAGALAAFRDAASPVGPRHDSRGGLGVLYRYGPRVILDAPENAGPPVIHHAVAERMAFGCDGYAPIVLPSTALVLLPNGATHPISGFAPDARVALVAPDAALTRAQAAVRAIKNPDPYIVSLVRDQVWWRRVTYFALLAAVILAGSLPWTARVVTDLANKAGNATAGAVGAASIWAEIWDVLVGIAGSITAVVASVLALIGSFIPSYAKPWVDSLTSLPITFLVVVAIVLILYQTNDYLRDRITDLARQAWFPSRRERGLTASSTLARPRGTFARFMRMSAVTNFVQKALASYVFPGLGIVAIYFILFVAVARGLVSVSEGRGDVCKSSVEAKPPPWGEHKILDEEFKTSDPCWATGALLEKGRTYTVHLKMKQQYFDWRLKSDMAGFTNFSVWHLIATPFRRWWSLSWFQPVARIGSYGDVQWALESVIGDTALPAGADRQAARPPSTIKKSGSGASPHGEIQYVSEFVALADGELFLYVNDVLLATPWGPISYFYDNNKGTAAVSILRHDNPPLPPELVAK